MNYQYRAINPDGGILRGAISAESPRIAARMLRQQGLNVVEIRNETEPQKTALQNLRIKKRGAQDVLIFMQQFCILLESGVSLEETVESLADAPGHLFLSHEFADMAASLRRGVSFSESLQSSQLSVPPYFYPLAEAGELTGKLAQAMREGVVQWEYEIRTANELRNALTYPMILIFSGISAVLLIFALVVPKFVKLLDKAQGEIPFLARVVLNTGSFVNEHIMWLGGIATGLLFFGIYAFFQVNMRQHIRDFLTRVPVLKNWILEREMGRWASMLSTLLENRVELLKALDLAQHHVLLTELRSRLSHVSQSVRNGATLAASLRDMGAITHTGYNLVRVGECSGELSRMLRSLASLYTEIGRNRMKRFLIILEPAAILIIGAAVGIIMAGIILAITSANNINL